MKRLLADPPLAEKSKREIMEEWNTGITCNQISNQQQATRRPCAKGQELNSRSQKGVG